MSRPRYTVWKWATGKCQLNRVRVRQYGRWQGDEVVSVENIQMEVGGKRWTLGHKDREKAKLQAMDKAAELHPGSRIERNRDRLMAMRRDLVRVARMAGAPEGYAPAILAYREHGRYLDKTILGSIGGYWDDGNPKLTWREAMDMLSLKVYGDHYHTNRRRVVLDVRRVAHEIGKPDHVPPRDTYRERGQWDPVTVMRHLETDTWAGVADALYLRRNKNFPGNREPESEAA